MGDIWVSHSWVSWVFSESETRNSERLVLLALAAHCDSEGTCYPSIPTIAKMCRISVEQAKRCVRSLVKNGHILRSVNGAPDSRIVANRRPNLYQILRPVDNDLGGDNSAVSPIQIGRENAIRGGESVSPNNQDLQQPKKKQVSDGYSDSFEEFWAAYPKRSGANPKKSAYRNWRARLREDIKPEDLIAAAAQYKRTRIGEDPKFVKQAVTFLGPDEHWKEALAVVTMNAEMGQEPTELFPTSGEAPLGLEMRKCLPCSGSGWSKEATDRGDALDMSADKCEPCNGRGEYPQPLEPF